MMLLIAILEMVESFKIQDTLTGKSFTLGSNLENKDGYKRINRYADITYSGVFNSSSNVNKLNEFNLSLANLKMILISRMVLFKINGVDTNLQVFQEDKDSQVFYGKDVLYNADGTSNLTKTDDVLGVQDTYIESLELVTILRVMTHTQGLLSHTDVKEVLLLRK
jgi:hypothetical protein